MTPFEDWKVWIEREAKNIFDLVRPDVNHNANSLYPLIETIQDNVVYLSRYVLSPCLQAPSTFPDALPPPSALPDSHNLPVRPATAAGVCLAASSNFRIPDAPNARLSSADFSTAAAARLLPGSDALPDSGSRFFAELYELYFAVFERGNTLNEYFLDQYLPSRAQTCHLIVLEYSDQTDTGFRAALGKDGILSIHVPDALASDLTDDWKLAEGFALDAWSTFRALGARHGESSCCDWVPAAFSKLSKSTVIAKLTQARKHAERRLLDRASALVESLDNVFPDASIPYSDKISRLLLMLQGNLCLIPWARRSANSGPCAIILLPIVSSGAACSWTFVLADGAPPPSQWLGLRTTAKRVFSSIVRDYPFEQHVSEDGRPESCGLLASAMKESRSGEELEKLQKLDEDLRGMSHNLNAMLRVAMFLTGQRHEARPCNYSFAYGPQEILKHIDKVVSNEYLRGHHACPGQGKAPGDPDSVAIRCAGHYSLFQREHVAGFVDYMRSPFALDRIVMLKVPPSEDLQVMRSQGILLDEYVRIRWLTWRLSSSYCTAGMAVKANGNVEIKEPLGCVAGGDGVLRMFFRGQLVLMWHKETERSRHQTRLGIEYEGYGQLRDSAPARLRSYISRALGFAQDSEARFVDDLVATICTISNAEGEGALFVFGGQQESCPALCDMTPDGFKMEWARERRLLDTEHDILRSLAVMDGAVHVYASEGREGPDGTTRWVAARRYIAAQPQDPVTGKRLDANCLVQLLDDAILLLKRQPLHSEPTSKPGGETGPALCPLIRRLREDLAAPEGRLVTLSKAFEDRLQRWVDDLGSKGTRHRSVFQLCLWSAEVNNRDVFGGFDQDGVFAGPLVCSISADGPVNVYRMYCCDKPVAKRCHLSDQRMCPGQLLWTERVIE